MFQEIYPLQFSPPKWWGPQKTRVLNVAIRYAKNGGGIQPLVSDLTCGNAVAHRFHVSGNSRDGGGEGLHSLETNSPNVFGWYLKPIGSMGRTIYIYIPTDLPTNINQL